MDAYEATKVVFSRIQALDPDEAAKIMGLLIIQDHGEKEMIRLAFGPESLLQTVMAKARRELGLLSASSSPTSAPRPQSPFQQLSRQNSGRAPPSPSPLSVSSPSSWAQAPVFSRNNGVAPEDVAGAGEQELMSPGNNGAAASFFPRAGDALVDDLQLQEQLAFLNDGGGATMNHAHQLGGTFDGGDCRSPGPGDGSGMFPYGLGWAPGHRRSASANELFLGDNSLGWKPCLYYARGFCKNGSSCRFVHGASLQDVDDAPVAEQQQQQCHDFLLRYKSQRLGHPSHGFPYSPTGSLPGSPSSASKCLSFLMQQQHNDNQRAAAAMILGGGDEAHKFMGRPRLDRTDLASMMNNPGSRQIYLTFPADSTFREEDVSGYFRMYGPVHDVRIPYQQKRMFGFVTFVLPETVRLILAKGNPHFICDARVLVKPYKEKGKVPDKYRKQQQQGDFSGCTTPNGLDGRADPFDLHQIGARMPQHSNSANEMMMRRKQEEDQQAAEFQHAVELQSRRLMGLQLLDLKSRAAAAATAGMALPTMPMANAFTASQQPGETTVVASPLESNEQIKGSSVFAAESNAAPKEGVDKVESADEANHKTDSDESARGEHNLPERPFASPTKSSTTGSHDGFSATTATMNTGGGTNHLLPSALDMPSPRPYFLPMSRLSSDHGAIGM
ncbi:zinc finger CCCH domain-containing protein 22 [Brachypodium distachyon]|uniref:C3H1-type domain-containing protein n=1 Tax=Brachypodium distachyon TaxID=15368 RepID=A0A0Q3HGA2_BRADI|nr:zinc finger CCCH domain-containing protein 22 [Brachypodium distachyon]XP_024313858.1 zinc finger CCCH domain-containing protein 22 [Brachypodium distachyon]KQK21862.1 hypothetical protein BRADI_1g63570v3 [Brachypodium distachyon]KQK21863.1 hypothetical protein BRADI_1g63570v3 [Brachypodium distachyon]PNT77483.1 hypothetical protein BRADI_1g63570v3 [Brachypodium distachyon]|eukprot:XP_014754243.1 zinc finger CCCH domain-containing protein 22 [Brachypodium distachyon]